MRLVSRCEILFRVLRCTAFNHMSCVIICDTILRVTRCYSSACYVVLGSMFSHSVCVIRCWSAACYNTLRVLGAHSHLLYTGYAYTLIYQMVSFAPSHVSSYQQEIMLSAARYTLLSAVFCNDFYERDVASILPDVLSVLALAVSCILAFDHPPCVISHPMLLCCVS
jgi:hypothetical protein